MATALDRRAEEQLAERLANETPLYAESYLKILPKQRRRGLIYLEPKPAQLLLDSKLEAQRLAGRMQMAIVLKSRQVGMSTWVQGKLIQRSTRSAHHNALVVAHDIETGGKLYAIGYRMWEHLPAHEEVGGRPLRPDIRNFKRTRFLHFGQRAAPGQVEEVWPDSSYFVDTAGEFESGRGGTYHALHASEYAFWPQAKQKFTALIQAIPDDADSLIVIESTANGHNHFRELWDAAYDGRSDFAPVFWPYWKEAECSRPFVNEAERAEFRVGDTDQSPYAEAEPELLEVGPLDTETGEHVPLTLEQLNWRRWAIENRTGGDVSKFCQEYPATPEEAFLATGSRVFEPMLLARARARAEAADPRFGEGGPISGALVAKTVKAKAGRHGLVDVPEEPAFRPARSLKFGEDPFWRFWLDYEKGELAIPEEGAYVVGVDVSEGLPESGEGDPAYQAIEVIDHRTLEQVAEYRSRIDPDLLAEHATLTAMLFNNAWLAVEKTGPGLAVVRKIFHDFHYARTYLQRKHQQRAEGQTDNLGWDTTRATKPLLIAGAAELLREETHGIKSRRLISELETLVRLPTGKVQPESGKYADLFMAWAIAQQVAREKPIVKAKDRERRRERARDIAKRYSAYR